MAMTARPRTVPATRRGQIVTWMMSAAVLGAILCGPWLAAQAEPQPQARSRVSSKPYDIMVMVVATGPGPAQVAISYPATVAHAALSAGIQELGKRVSFKPGQVAIRDAPLAKQVAASGTDAQFNAPGLVSPSGRLPVGPIVHALPDWEHMRLVFILDPSYPFSGPLDVTTGGFAVRLANRVTTYEYDVERMKGKPAATGGAGSLPNPGKGDAATGASGEKPGASSASSVSRQVLPSMLIGLPSGLLAGWLLYGWRERRSRARRAASARAGTIRPTSAGRPSQTGQGT